MNRVELEVVKTFVLKNIDELPDVVKQILPAILKSKIVILTGDLGAGKTTLVKEVCQQLGVYDLVSSPTFSIINEYDHDGVKVFHMDLYRIEDEEELLNLGFEDYLYSGNLVFIEWPQIADRLLPSETIGIHIEIFDNSSRRLNLSNRS